MEKKEERPDYALIILERKRKEEYPWESHTRKRPK
jgi:hypothetical protein